LHAGIDKEKSYQAYLEIGESNGKPFRVDANIVATGRSCVIGASGSGKSYAVAVICEELCKAKVPFVILDTEGEYAGLKEKYEVILISEDPNADLAWNALDFHDVAEQAADIAPLILDLSEVEDPKGKASNFLEELYKSLSEKRVPYLVIVEEADRFVPQSGIKMGIIGEIARRGRKRGIGLMVCTQRPSLVDKNILSQCGNQLIGKLVIQNDLQAVSQFFAGRSIPRQLTSLSPGNFYAMGGFSASPSLIKVRNRETRHIGATPLLKERIVKPYMGTLISAHERQSKKVSLKGFKPIVDENEVSSLVKRHKEHFLFGEEEKIASLTLAWKKLCETVLVQRRGVLMKKFKARYMIFDPETKSVVSGLEPLRYERGFDKLWGLPQNLITVLKALDADKRQSLIEIDSKVRLGKNYTRAALKKLEAAALVSSFDMGKIKVYRRIVELPRLKLFDEPLKLDDVEIEPEKNMDPDLKQVREMVKALVEDADVSELRIFYYPLFRAELVLKSSRRLVYIDARTGQLVNLG
jgi:hypothetical protein